VAVSPDPYTIRFCNPRNLSLVNPIVTSSTVGRSSREGGFVITLAGRGFPSASLASCTPRVSFGSAVVSATFGYGSGNLPVLVCAVPTHEPALVPLSVSFDGQTFVRGGFRLAALVCLAMKTCSLKMSRGLSSLGMLRGLDLGR
jgi:hypothetical protein